MTLRSSSESGGYGIGSWYPVLRGGPAPVDFFDAAEGRDNARLVECWSNLGQGGRVVLQSSASPGSKPSLGRLEETLVGTGQVERFIVFPGTGGSFTLLPTLDGSALRGGMPLLPRGRLRGRALWALLRAASPLGIAQRLGRPELAIWTKGPCERDSKDLPALPVAGSIAIAAGVPGRNQKIIVRALDRRGVARAILKIGTNERSDDAVMREADALNRMVELAPERSPRLLADGSRADRSWMAQEVIEGRHAGDGLTAEHAKMLIELARLGRDSIPLNELPTFRDSKNHLTNLEPTFDPDWHAEYTRLRDAIEGSIDGAPVPVNVAHGDFTPWNVVKRRGAVRAFDWEYFAESAPALYDAIHFHIQSSVLVRQAQGKRIFDELGRFLRGPVREVVAATRLDRVQILRALALYVFHEGTTAEVQERLRPAPFIQATWLRRARLELCQRLAGLLLERQIPDWLIGHGEGAPDTSPTTSDQSTPQETIDNRDAA